MSAGAPCWFAVDNATPQTITPTNSVQPLWQVLTDGVDAGTDVILHDGDASALEVVNPGLYLLTAMVGVHVPESETGPVTVSLAPNINDNMTGPGYYASGQTVVRPAHPFGVGNPVLAPVPLVFTEGDLIRFDLSNVDATLDLSTGNSGFAVLLRLGDAP